MNPYPKLEELPAPPVTDQSARPAGTPEEAASVGIEAETAPTSPRDEASVVSQLLARHAAGDREAYGQLLPLVYERLRGIARASMRGARGHTLAPTALVHEAFLVLGKREDLQLQSRAHFFNAVAQCMRWVLMDYAKARASMKRGGNQVRVSFDEKLHSEGGMDWDLVSLNEALEKLSADYPRVAKLVELRFLVGLSFEEAAEAMEVSVITAKRDWAFAKAWLAQALKRAEAEGATE